MSFQMPACVRVGHLSEEKVLETRNRKSSFAQAHGSFKAFGSQKVRRRGRVANQSHRCPRFSKIEHGGLGVLCSVRKHGTGFASCKSSEFSCCS